jgi:hypothetical protein
MKAYNYNQNYIYTGEVNCQWDERDARFLVPRNATTINIIECDDNLEYLQLVNNEWIKKDIVLNGNFYLKTSGKHETSILKKDSLLYINIPPDIEIRNDINQNGDIITTDEIAFINDKWQYVTNTNATLLFYREEKKRKLKREYSQSKLDIKFYIGNIWIHKLNGGLEDAITELGRRVIISDPVGTDFTASQTQQLLYIAMHERERIRNNLEDCKNEIDALNILQDIHNYAPSIEYKFPPLIDINNYV